MSNIPITPGTGAASVAGETVGGITYQQIEVYGGGGASVLAINPDGSIKASIIGVPTVSFSGSPSISGAVTIVGTPSISGTVLVGNAPSVFAAVSGSVVGFQGGAWSTSVVGTVSVIGTVSVVGTVGVSGTPSISGTIQVQYAPPASLISGVTSVITGTTSVLVLQTPPGGQRNYITQVLATNVSATQTTVFLYDGPSIIYAGVLAGGGGFSASFPAPLRQATTSNLGVISSVASSILVSASGFTAP